MRIILILFLFFGVFTNSAISQVDDNLTWTSIQLTKTFNEKSSIALKPIVRHHMDISKYQNSSIDLSYRYKLKKGWYLQGLTRYWFIPDNTDRYFLWFDVGYGKAFGQSKLSSNLRYHHAFDLKDRIDPDFIRLKLDWAFPSIGKITPVFAFEPFLRVDDIGKIVRLRYEPGIKWKISDTLNLTARFRREVTANVIPKRKFNVGVMNLVIKI